MTTPNTPQSIIEAYAQSINTLDTALARSLWSGHEAVSFIHPRGHEVGLDNILQAFYIDTMGRFSQRDLQPRDIQITTLDDTAIATFYWDFYATFASDGTRHVTHGRETQVMVREGGQWRLAHVHYSGMPVTGAREGF